MIVNYLLIGLGVYIGAWLRSDKSFRDYHWIALTKGFLGILVWPVFVVLAARYKIKKGDVHL